MEVFYSILILLWVDNILTKGVTTDVSPNPGDCNSTCVPENCPKPQYCKGDFVKDSCGCCSVCSTDSYQQIYNKYRKKKGGPCEEVACPRRRVCVENMQGLPLCTCPNIFICRRRRKPICGSDGNTYSSRCHMRVTSCNVNKRIRLKHKGACEPKRFSMNSMVATQQYGGSVKYPESEFDIRRRRRKNRRKERRKHRKEKRRRKRRFRKKYNDKNFKNRRQRRRLRKRMRKNRLKE